MTTGVAFEKADLCRSLETDREMKIVLERAASAFARSLRAGAMFDRIDATFSRWPAAGLALLAIVLALVYTTVSSG